MQNIILKKTEFPLIIIQKLQLIYQCNQKTNHIFGSKKEEKETLNLQAHQEIRLIL